MSKAMQRLAVPAGVLGIILLMAYYALLPFLPKGKTSGPNWSWGSSAVEPMHLVASSPGTVTVAQGTMALTIHATSITPGGECNYNAKWTSGDQIGSFNPFPCTENGYNAFLKWLEDAEKVGDNWLQELRSIKFWGP